MNLDNDSIAFFFKKYRNLLIAGGLALILALLAVLAFTDWLGNWIDWHKIGKLDQNINAAQQNANQINANLVNINAQIENKQSEVNALQQNHNQAELETNRAREDTNRALENLNRVKKQNFNNTSLEAANKARCRAFPDAPECQK